MSKRNVRQSQPSDPLLVVEDLRIAFEQAHGWFTAVRGLDFSVEPGEVLGIVGESGSGKSVTVRALLGLLPSSRCSVTGRAHFLGQDLLALTDAELDNVRGREAAMIFQDPMSSLNPVLSIESQVVEGYLAHRKGSRSEVSTMAEDSLRRVGLPRPSDLLHRYPHELSGGMRQRVLIAMALMTSPVLLIADEPTTALDVTVQAQILELLRSLVADEGMALIIISHDVGVIAELADKVAVMYDGRIVESGDVVDVLTTPQHPYTRGLIEATPKANSPALPEPIPGAPPALDVEISGCSFHVRCRYAQPSCAESIPPLIQLVGDHWAACPVVAGKLDATSFPAQEGT